MVGLEVVGKLGACRAYLFPRHQKQAYTKLDTKHASPPATPANVGARGACADEAG